jgi:hypothetical protein
MLKSPDRDNSVIYKIMRGRWYKDRYNAPDIGNLNQFASNDNKVWTWTYLRFEKDPCPLAAFVQRFRGDKFAGIPKDILIRHGSRWWMVRVVAGPNGCLTLLGSVFLDWF